MYLGRVGVAIGVTAAVMGTAWAIPGGDGLKQLQGRMYGQKPIEPEEIGMRATAGRGTTRYSSDSPSFQVSLPSEWQIYSAGESSPGTLTFISGGDSTSVPPSKYPEIASRLRKPQPSRTAGPQVSGLISTVGQRCSDSELKELRAFATRTRVVPTDGRRVEIYSYRLLGTVPGSTYNVSVATTVAGDAKEGKTEFKMVYYPRMGEADGSERLSTIAKSFKSEAAPAPTPPAAQPQPATEPSTEPAQPSGDR